MEGIMAERMGFEPTRELSPPTRFPVAPVRPLQHLSGTRAPGFGPVVRAQIIALSGPKDKVSRRKGLETVSLFHDIANTNNSKRLQL